MSPEKFWILITEVFTMLKIKSRKNKNETRPKKRGAAKRRRVLEHKRRLAALGVPEEKINRLTPKEMHELLKRPKKTEAEYSK